MFVDGGFTAETGLRGVSFTPGQCSVSVKARNDIAISGVPPRIATRILGFGIAGYSLFFFWLAHLKFVCMTHHSGDIAGFNNAFWYTLHGRFFYMVDLGMSYFGDKSGWLFVLALPFYWLWPNPHTLIFLSCVAAGLSAIPVYLLAVHALRDRTAGLLSTAAYLFFPTIVSQTVNQINMLQFVAGFVALALYFFCVNRYPVALVCCALACLLGSDDIGLTMLMFLPYAFVKRRGVKWALGAALISVVFFAVAFAVIMPAFRGDRPYRPLGYLANLGGTPGEILHTLALDPSKTLAALLTRENFLYLLLLVQPVLWLSPWFSWEVLFAVPYLAINLLAANMSMKSIAFHYNVTVGMFLCVATIFAVRKWSERLRNRWGPARYEVGFATLYLCLAVTSWPLWLNLSEYQPRPYHPSQLAALNLVPPGKSVVAPETMLGLLSDRERFNSLNGLFLYTHEDMFSYEYLVFDGNDRALEPWVTQDFLNKVASHPGYELIFSQQNVFVFRRRPAS